MQSLNTMVAQGKVLYLGISDTPAWVVSKANEYARQNGLRQFSVYQGRWSAEHRDFEREIIPMCAAVSDFSNGLNWGSNAGVRNLSPNTNSLFERYETDVPIGRYGTCSLGRSWRRTLQNR